MAALRTMLGVDQRSRLLKPAEIYPSMYYDSRIKCHVEEERGGCTLSQGKNLSLIKDVTQKIFNAESEEVKAVIAGKHQELKDKRERARAMAGDNSGEPSKHSPEEYQR
jgi:hypothetical protein